VNAITTSNIGFSYPAADQAALNDVSITIPQGSCFGLLGPNGAGKSTLLALLTGILPLQQGEVIFSSQSTASALVPQDFAFYPSLTVQENLSCFAGLYGFSGARKQVQIAFAVHACGLEETLAKRAAQCSGGVRRRLNLAIGLLNQPQILFLDEPTVGIDAQSRHFILNTIRQLQQSGMTIVYTSHYMEEIQDICDVLAIIDHGKLLLQDTLANILQRAEAIPVTTEKKNAQRLEDFYLSLTNTALRD
jgi:ABC-2 type transport system ATP-binding protein